MFFGPGPRAPFFGLVHVFLTWLDFFWTWGHKKCGGRACVFSGPCGDIFFGPACLCAGPREFFFDSQITVIVSELGFCFLDPCTCFVDLASIGWGGNSIVIGAHIGLDVFGPWSMVFLNPYVFFGPGRGWWECRY